MAVIQFGSHMASTTLNSFKPLIGTTSYVSILSVQQIAADEVFWIPKDIDTDTFGPIKCESPLARKAFGNPSQTYSMPVFVHNAMNDPNGNLMVWKLSNTLYNQLLELSKQGDLTQYTICVTARKQGQGTRTEMSILPQPILRSYWTPEFKAKIDESVKFWFEYCDTTLYQTLTEPELITLLQNAGYDFTTNSFPNRIAQGSYFAKQAVGSVFNQGQPQIQMNAPQISIAAQPTMTQAVGTIPAPQVSPVVTPNVVPVEPSVNTIPVVTPEPTVATPEPAPVIVGSPVSPIVGSPAPSIVGSPATPGVIPTAPTNPVPTPQSNINEAPVVSTMSQADVNALFDDSVL